MYIIKNAIINIKRKKSRNILNCIIITIITIGLLISLSINKSSKKIKENYINSNPIEVSLSLDMRNKSDDVITEEDIKKYGSLEYVKNYYYTYQTSLSSSDIDPINNDIEKNNFENDKEHNRMPKENQGDFKFVAYSDISYISEFINGENKITSGNISDLENENTILISSSLALENDININDEIEFYDINDTSKKYKLKVVAIYDVISDDNDNFMNINTLNKENQIYINIETIKNILGENTGNINAKFYLKKQNDIENFKEGATKLGLSSNYKLIDNKDSIEESLKIVENVKTFSMTLLIIIIIIGTLILIIINIINIKDRTYEIGVLRAIGMSKIKVSIEFLIESFITTLISIIIGVIIGIAVLKPITNTMLKNEINSYKNNTNQIQNNFKLNNVEKNKFNRINDNVKYIDNLNVNIDFYIILKLFAVIITLTIISNIITIVLINKYEPNKILQKRV